MKRVFWIAVFVTVVVCYVFAGIYIFASLLMSNDAPAWMGLLVSVLGMAFGGVPAMLTMKEFGIIEKMDN